MGGCAKALKLRLSKRALKEVIADFFIRRKIVLDWRENFARGGIKRTIVVTKQLH